MKDTASFGGQRDKAELQTPPGSWEAQQCPPLHAQMEFKVRESKAASTDGVSFLQHSVPSCPYPAPMAQVNSPIPLVKGSGRKSQGREEPGVVAGTPGCRQPSPCCPVCVHAGGRGKGQYRDVQGVIDPKDDRLVTYPRAAKRSASPQLLTPLTAAPSPMTPQGPPYSRHSRTVNGYRGRHGHISSPWPCSQALCSHCY